MGYDISEAKHQKLIRNRAAGRLCGGATRARGGCSTPAKVRQRHEFWLTTEDKEAGKPPYKIDGEGEGLTVCRAHAYEVGYEGGNFRVIASESF